MSRVIVLVFVTSVALSGAGCVGCPTALLEGVLVDDGSGGLAVKAPEGAIVPVHWPDGVGVGMADGHLALKNPLGFVIAREGEFVSMGGGSAMDGPGFAACGPIAVKASGPPTQ